MSAYPGAAKVVSPIVGEPVCFVAVRDGMIATGWKNVIAYDGNAWFPIDIPVCEKGKQPQ
jgi:hypothetical protein